MVEKDEYKLLKYEGKKVRVIFNTGEEYTGIIDDYVYPDDDNEGLECLIFRSGLGFYERDIKFIEIIE